MNDLIPYPKSAPPYFNGHKIACDMAQGPCSCGTWHKLEDWPERFEERYNADLPIQFHTMILEPIRTSQGYAPLHVANPHHERITELGWTYSHTTLIRRPDGSQTALHTYLLHGHAVGVSCTPGWPAECGRLGSSRRYTYYGNSLYNYLKRKVRELERRHNQT